MDVLFALTVSFRVISDSAVARILLAFLLGSAIGWERERHGREAGLRTHMLLCVGCALIMLISLYMPLAIPAGAGEVQARADVGRIASQALSGLGFLGAGAIIVLGAHIRGLTTAASIWVTAAIGLAVGAGYLGPALLTWAVAMFGLMAMGRLERVLPYRDRYIHLVMTFSGKQRRREKIHALLEGHGLTPLHSTADHRQGRMLYRLVLRHRHEVDFEEVTLTLTDRLDSEGLCSIEWSEGPSERIISSGGNSS